MAGGDLGICSVCLVFCCNAGEKMPKDDPFWSLLKSERYIGVIPILNLIILAIEIVIQSVKCRLIKSATTNGIVRQMDGGHHTDTLGIEHLQQASHLSISAV